MRTKGFTNEISSGLTSYMSAYKLVREGYPGFTLAFVSVSLLFIFTSVLSAFLPFILKKTAEAYYSSEGALQIFFSIAMTYAICWTIAEVLKNIKGIFSASILARSDAALTDRTLDALLTASFKKQREFNPAVLSANIERGSMSFSSLTISIFWTLIPIFVEIVTALFFIYQVLGLTYSVSFLFSIIAMILLAVYIAILSRNIHADIMNAQNGIHSYTIERLNIPLDIRINSAHKKEKEIRTKVLTHYVKTIAVTNKKMGFLLSIQAIMVGALLAASVLALVFFRETSRSGTGDFIMIAGYISLLTFQLRLIAGSCIDIQRQFVYLNKLLEYIDEQQEGFDKETITLDKKSTYVFDVKDLTSLVGTQVILKGITFRVKKGEMFAISAPSGFGKSTILTHILGLVPPDNGSISFEGVPVSINISSVLLNHIAVVPQKAVLIHGTIRENILYGTDDAIPDSELIDIIKHLGLINDMHHNNVIEFLEREITPHGGGLSGGEMQRICIARALARRVETIVLDEPTASIGEESAIKIIKYIRERSQTVLITTHNPRILSLADNIFEGNIDV